MGKRSAVVELFLGDMGSMQRELLKAVNQLPKSVVREIRTPRSVGAGAADRLRRPGGRGEILVPTATIGSTVVCLSQAVHQY